ncbi:hypothetical protein KSP39_PZI007044 [Platanthera zijinensis]|uniref:Uncharacterized protein n=2 Tax=Platanthera zijinensis TaxID=2320716 RepID=A0AAP0BQB1_9ASPA
MAIECGIGGVEIMEVTFLDGGRGNQTGNGWIQARRMLVAADLRGGTAGGGYWMKGSGRSGMGLELGGRRLDRRSDRLDKGLDSKLMTGGDLNVAAGGWENPQAFSLADRHGSRLSSQALIPLQVRVPLLPATTSPTIEEQGSIMDPFERDPETENHYAEALHMGLDSTDYAMVAVEMEAALKEYDEIGSELRINFPCRSLVDDPSWLARWIVGEDLLKPC